MSKKTGRHAGYEQKKGHDQNTET